MDEFGLIRLEWNNYNGFIFHLLHFEWSSDSHQFEGSLLGFHCSRTHLIFEIFFIWIEIKSPFI
jgi:hypothetical protein